MRLGLGVQPTFDLPPDMPDTPPPPAPSWDPRASVAGLQTDLAGVRAAVARLTRASHLAADDERDVLALLGLDADDADEAPLDA